MEEEVKKNNKTALPSQMMVVLGGENSFVFAKIFIQINGECPEEIVKEIVKEIEGGGNKT